MSYNIKTAFTRRANQGFKCFSPEVMLATFIIEVILAVYSFVRFRLNRVTLLTCLILVLLATFQAIEYNLCASGFLDPLLAARLGYVAITLLPPLGIHLAYEIAGVKKRFWLLPGYILAGLFGLYFLTAGQGLTSHACAGNYVIFEVLPASQLLYTLYYYGLLAVGVWLSITLARAAKQTSIKRALIALMVGYVAFIGPTTLVNVINQDTIAGIPSIMCGFAVLFAVALAGWVLPSAVPSKIDK